MKTKLSRVFPSAGWTLVALLTLSTTSPAEENAIALKSTFKDAFMVGAALNPRHFNGQDTNGVALVKSQFNSISPENTLKWDAVHPREGEEGYNFGPADAYVNFGSSNNMYVVGHVLVWHSQTPNWVFAGTNPPPELPNAATNAAVAGPGRGGIGRGYTGPRASRDELLQRMRDHIHKVVGRYKGRIKAWDVVNEAIADGNGTNLLRKTLWLEIIGPDFIAKAFQYAHEADPDAVLRYNDYGLENPVKRQKLVTLIKSLQAEKVPVTAIGSQAHLNVSTSFEIMDRSLSEMETLGLPIHITELDVNSAASGQRGTGADIAANAATTQGGLVEDANKKQTEAYAGIFRAFLKHRNSVKVVTFWRVTDRDSWRRFGTPLLFDGTWQPKPSFQAVIDEASKALGGK